jgi:hypothetical protein
MTFCADGEVILVTAGPVDDDHEPVHRHRRRQFASM